MEQITHEDGSYSIGFKNEQFKNKEITPADMAVIRYINTRVREELFKQITNI